jgi:hypothetical protein
MAGAASTGLVTQWDQHFTVTATGLTVKGQPSLQRCEGFLRRARVVQQGLQFAIGDAIRYMEDTFGEEAAQVIDPDLGWSRESIRNFVWVAEHVLPENRRSDLTWSHHQVVASLSPAKQREWLARAVGDGEGGAWSRGWLKAAISADANVEPSYWVLVRATSAEDQAMLVEQLEGDGRECKAIRRSGG